MSRLHMAGLGILAAVLTIVGAIGTWASYQGHTWAGTDANRGKTVAIAAGVAIVFLALTAWRGWRWSAALGALAGILSFGFTVWTLTSINKFVGAPSSLSIGKGWGIWVALIASAVLVLAALAATFMPRPAVAAAAPPAAPPASPPPPETPAP